MRRVGVVSVAVVIAVCSSALVRVFSSDTQKDVRIRETAGVILDITDALSQHGRKREIEVEELTNALRKPDQEENRETENKHLQ